MRFWVAALVCIALLACSGPSATLVGTWRSDRTLTLRELARAPRLESKQRELFSGPYFFGDLVLEIDESHITSVLPYHRASDPYRVLESGADFVVVESTDASGAVETLRCRFRDGQLLVPVREYGFHEVFVRVTGKE